MRVFCYEISTNGQSSGGWYVIFQTCWIILQMISTPPKKKKKKNRQFSCEVTFCVFSIYVLFYSHRKLVGRTRTLSSEWKLTKLILHIGCPSWFFKLHVLLIIYLHRGNQPYSRNLWRGNLKLLINQHRIAEKTKII